MIEEGEDFTDALRKNDKDRFAIVSIGKVLPGSMIQFKYDAKHKDTLTFWDAMPVVIVLRKTASRMLGLNLHFVPFMLRKLLAEYVVKRNLSNIKNNKPMYIDYKMIKSFLIAIKATICIRMYLTSRVGSQITMVKSHKDYIIGATTLKTQKLYKMTSDQIYKIALGQEYSTKKKVGQRRVDRANKKKVMKK